MKKLWLLVSFFLCFTLDCSAKEARTEYISGDYKYILLEDGTAEITDYSGKFSYFTIPAKLDGYIVSSIGDDAFVRCDRLIDVTIPDSVIFIGNRAFSGCKNLFSITIPDSVTSIGRYAFDECESLTSITLPDSVTSLGLNPFSKCHSLKSIKVSPDHPIFATIDGVLFNKTEKKLLCFPCAFPAKQYIIPQGITSIGEWAFYFCDSLTSIIIPDSVTSIGEWAFYSCDSLTSIIIPDSVTSIGDWSFCRCNSLSSVTIPNSVTFIGQGAFGNCDNLTSITISEGVTFIGDGAFNSCDSLNEVTIPDSVTALGGNPFSGCPQLKSIKVFPDHPVFTTVDGVLFNKIENKLICYPFAFTAEQYIIPQGITAIGNDAFSGCDNLTSITIPDSVISIDNYAFSDCTNLSSIAIPDSVIFIGNYAFSNCTNLSTISVSRDSYAAQYCNDNGLPYTYPDANGWLNN